MKNLVIGLSALYLLLPLAHAGANPCQIDLWLSTNGYEVVDARPQVLEAIRSHGLEPALWGAAGSFDSLLNRYAQANPSYRVLHRSWMSDDKEIGQYVLTIDSNSLRILSLSTLKETSQAQTIAKASFQAWNSIPKWDGGTPGYEKAVENRNLDAVEGIHKMLSQIKTGCGRDSALAP